MKQRLLVMNGQRLLQEDTEGKWKTVKVDKAQGLKPGIYDLHLARIADKALTHEGAILFADKEHVFQQIGKAMVKHDRNQFEVVPGEGTSAHITYVDNKAMVARVTISTGRGRSR